MKSYYIYILTNKNNSVLYVGVINDIVRRIWEHKSKLIEGFTKKYNVDKLVYYEKFDDPKSVIAREKQLKAGSRKKKLDLISSFNKDWKDLFNLDCVL
ncbi:MAG: GIY-YIG nuclease family protein [Ignavibacteria bacterium]|nr:GIY-YIG nuclease family protein [Ignavibacteria bacterium]